MNLTGILRSLLGALTAPRTRSTPGPVRRSGGGSSLSNPRSSPGQSGAEATVEVPLSVLRSAALRYAPHPDGDPDPGEVVWTWVPYEENDGRGKDRPLVIVARDGRSAALGVYLTSKPHDDDARHFVSIGPGPWDSQGRPSWARLDRAFRVFDSGMRREAAALSAAQFSDVASALRARI